MMHNLFDCLCNDDYLSDFRDRIFDDLIRQGLAYERYNILFYDQAGLWTYFRPNEDNISGHWCISDRCDHKDGYCPAILFYNKYIFSRGINFMVRCSHVENDEYQVDYLIDISILGEDCRTIIQQYNKYRLPP